MEPSSTRAAGSGCQARRSILSRYLKSRRAEENKTGSLLNLQGGESVSTRMLFCLRVLTMRQRDTGSIHDGLGQLMIITLERYSRSLQGVPDLLAALEGWRRVPKFIPLAP